MTSGISAISSLAGYRSMGLYSQALSMQSAVGENQRAYNSVMVYETEAAREKSLKTRHQWQEVFEAGIIGAMILIPVYLLWHFGPRKKTRVGLAKVADRFNM